MSAQTAAGGGSPAAAGGPSAGGRQIFEGGPEAGAGGVTGSDTNAAAGKPDPAAGQPKGTPGSPPGVSSPHTVGLAQVFEGGPEAGAGGVTGSDANAAAGKPDPAAGQPKGTPGPAQSNDNLSLPVWVQQVDKKLTADPDSAARLAAFDSLSDMVKSYLDLSAQAAGQQPAIPGEGAAPEEVQAFYERLGKPKEAAGYPFAKDSPDFAQAAFAANLSAGQADSLFKASLAQLDVARKGIQTALAQDFQATDALLQKEYGERYGEAVALMQRGLGNDPATGALSPVAKALVSAGLAGKPEIVRAFIELGRAVSESRAPAGSSAGAHEPKSIRDGRGFKYS